MPGLTGYQQRRLDLADMLRAVLHLAHRYGDEGRERDIRELLGRLAAGRFRLAVAGQFSRGKTTLMNALLGDSFLPTGALPVTSVVTTVRYGTRARALIRSRAGGLPVEVPVAEAARFIAQSSADRTRMKVTSVEIEVPAELLRLGFEFIDTPGVGSAIAANTAATMRFLPRADAVVVVTGFDSALTQAEADFIAASAARAGHVFLVINKRDLVSEQDAAAVTGYVQDWARENLPGSRHHVFGLSALAALDGATSDDDRQLADSGFEPFRAELTRFLTTQQGSTALRAVATAATSLVRRQASELRAGLQAGQDDAGAARLTGAFDEQVSALRAGIETTAGEIADRLSAALPQLLDGRRAAWTAELRGRLADAAGQPAASEAGGTPRPAGWSAPAVGQAAAGWLEQTAADLQDRIVGLVAGRIGDLLEAVRSPRELGAALAGQPPCAGPPAGWQAGQVPDLLIPAIEWDSASPPAGRQRRRSRPAAAGGSLDPAGGAEAAIGRFIDQARSGFESAAIRWAGQLGEQAMRDMTAEARQFRRYLETRPPAGDLAILAGLDRRLAGFLESLHPEPTATAAASVPGPAPRPPRSPAGQPRCEICSLAEDELTDFLVHRQFLLATSEADQARHARARGFCPVHTWRFAHMSSPVGISAGLAALIRSVADQIDSARRAGGAAGEVAGLLDSLVAAAGCPACAALARREARAAAQLAAGTDAPGAPVLCLRHLALVLHAGPSLPAGTAMASRTATALRRAAEDMRSYALKREALRHSLVTGDEERAYLDALRLLAGAPALAQPREPG